MSRSEFNIDLNYGIDLIWLIFFILLRKGLILDVDLDLEINTNGFLL